MAWERYPVTSNSFSKSYHYTHNTVEKSKSPPTSAFECLLDYYCHCRAQTGLPNVYQPLTVFAELKWALPNVY